MQPEKVYPGDDVVDVVALDLYNQSWRPQDATDPEARWRNLVSQPYGLDWLRAFAARHGKPIALPEWGTGTQPRWPRLGRRPLVHAQHGGLDRGQQRRLYTYWDYNAGDFNGEISTGRQPNAAAAFKEGFGPKN